VFKPSATTADTTTTDWRSGRDCIVSKDAIAEPARIQRALRGAWFLCGVIRRIGRPASRRRGFKRSRGALGSQSWTVHGRKRRAVVNPVAHARGCCTTKLLNADDTRRKGAVIRQDVLLS
jgi:hypothetical protein